MKIKSLLKFIQLFNSKNKEFKKIQQYIIKYMWYIKILVNNFLNKQSYLKL